MISIVQLICTVLLLVPTGFAKELVFSHVLYRHGARAPSENYPTDPHSADVWPQGWKELTQVGMLQQQELGQFIRNRYVPVLLSPNYTKEEIYVRSSDEDRALQSALSNLAGLFPPSGRQIWNRSIAWQPIPVHSFLPEEEDILLKPTSVKCPAYDAIYEGYSRSVFEPYNQQYASFFSWLKEKTGFATDMTIGDADDIYSTLVAERTENLPLPRWVDEEWNNSGRTVWDIVNELKRVTRVTDFSHPELSRLLGGYLVGDIIQRMQQKAAGQLKTPKKMIMYSAHDGTVMALMYAMQIENGLLTPFTSCVFVELYKEGNNYNVEVYYRNNTVTPLYPLTVPGCPQHSCPLERLASVLRSRMFLTREQWAEACATKQSLNAAPPPRDFGRVFVIAFLSALAIFLNSGR